jgi:hypothetical protein|tara:strand:+ start:72 stop:1025 length:954 start_codon:yes stop_codon:yes gene_type:complete
MLGQFGRNLKRGFDKAEKIMEARQDYRHSVIDPKFFKNVREGYKGPDRSRKGAKNVNIEGAANAGEFLGAYAARVSTDILSDGTRQFYWRYNHPLAIGQKLVEQAVPQLGDIKSPLQRALVTGAVGAPTAASLGIFDVTNPSELFRPKGYAQSYAEKGSDDRRKTAEPGMEIFDRFFLGRRGRPLKYETAKKDIPSLTPERYGKAMRSQYQDRGVLGMGLLKGTTENIEGYPEIRVVGFPVGLQAAGATAGGIAGLKTAVNKNLLTNRGSRSQRYKAAGITLAGALGGAATGKTLNMAIAGANRPSYLTTSEYTQGK